MGHAPDCNCPPCRYRRGEDLGQAPRLTVRLRSDVREFLLGHAEGARGLIERLVDQERQGQTDRGRIQNLEQELGRLQKQLAAVQGPGVLDGTKGQLSDNRPETAVSPLESYAARFRENFRKHTPARGLAHRLGLKGELQVAIGVGYCGTRGIARNDAERKELQKLGLMKTNGRERLAGRLTIPLSTHSGKLSGFWGCDLRTRAEQTAGMAEGLLATGPLGEELVLVDGVVECLAAFGAGSTSIQAMELLRPGWFPTLREAGVRKVWLALHQPEQARKIAGELVRCGMECWLVPVPEDRESRVDLLEHAPGWALVLKKATRYQPNSKKVGGARQLSDECPRRH